MLTEIARKRSIGGAALLVCLSLCSTASARPDLPYFEEGDLTPYFDGDARFAEHEAAGVGEFHALDQEGRPVTERSFTGKISLVTFFFARCGNTCPRMMGALSRFQERLKKSGLASRVAVYSFSITPEVDLPAVLLAYARAHAFNLAHWSIVTGQRDEIFRVGRTMFKADRSVGPTKDEATFVHSEDVYLVDSARKLRGIYDTSSEAQMSALAKDIDRLVAER